MSNNIYSGYFLEKNLEYALKLKYKVHCIIINAKFLIFSMKILLLIKIHVHVYINFQMNTRGRSCKNNYNSSQWERVSHNNLYVFGLMSNEIHSVGIMNKKHHSFICNASICPLGRSNVTENQRIFDCYCKLSHFFMIIQYIHCNSRIKKNTSPHGFHTVIIHLKKKFNHNHSEQ